MLVNLVDDGLIAFRGESPPRPRAQEQTLNAKIVELAGQGREILGAMDGGGTSGLR